MKLKTITEAWEKVSKAELDKIKKGIFDLIDTAYKDIGGHIKYKSPSDIEMKNGKYFEIIDIDKDGIPDGVEVIKSSKPGKKFIGLGHDGTKPAKREVIKRQIELLKKSGYYVEVSGKMYDIFKSSNVPVVNDEATVSDVLGKDIEWLEGGWYKRNIGGSKRRKIMMGFPKT